MADEIEVRPPDGWGPARTLIVQLEQLCYTVTEWRVDGQSVLKVTGPAQAPRP
jgi:hypothetical protein